MSFFNKVACGFLLLSILGSLQAGEEPALDIEVYDQRFYDFINTDAALQVLADDLGWAEGPVWVDDMNALLFSDVAANRVYRWQENSGLSVFLEPSGHNPDAGGTAWRGSNGLAIAGDGSLLLAQQSSRRVARMRTNLNSPTPDYEVLVNAFEGKSLNSPNDLVTHNSGDVYFTDPPYGLDGFENSPAIELEFFGVFRLAADGQIELVYGDLAKPNGLAFSLDQSRLYVSNSATDQAMVVALELDEQGMVKSSSVFYDFTDFIPDGPGSTDGMTLHPSGHLFVSIPNGLAVLTPDGELLGKINLGQVTNLAIGGSPAHLYITTPNRLLRLKL